jgi:hypothetical protein
VAIRAATNPKRGTMRHPIAGGHTVRLHNVERPLRALNFLTYVEWLS